MLGFTAFVLRALVEIITNNKFNFIQKYINIHYITTYDITQLWIPFFILLSINVGACLIGSVLVIFYAPAAGKTGFSIVCIGHMHVCGFVVVHDVMCSLVHTVLHHA